jgi:deoxyribodipyrimidine photolyase
VKTQVIIDLEADENLCERGEQTAIIDLEADDARDTLRVQHKTENTLRRGISLRSCAWYYMDPQGEQQGPFVMEHLRLWWRNNYFPENFKVWREGETSDSAVFLRDVLY